MARARVMSFMAGLQNRVPGEGSRSRDGSRERSQYSPAPRQTSFSVQQKPSPTPSEPPSHQPAPAGRQRSASRPMSMIGGYQPPMMPVASDTLPELAPIFTLLNSHSNKLYQEGYFLKLNDLDTHGRPFPDRLWTECFAQLVGIVLSLWDAAALDAAGDDGEVAPTFINLGDASIKMIESLPTRSGETQPLTNVLSISTAGKNRYLLHFSTINAMTQWTAGIRLAMYENACLQEAYTGSLIAGKGRTVNNIKTIMERLRFKTEEWTRVRFGAGTPWRRCWCVISPPDEKDLQAQKKATKKKSAYDRSAQQLKGDIKFYDTRKITKKTRPVATIRDAFSAYAIYPQSKALIDQSTLIKIEGPITIHTDPEVTTEGFVFVMPEVHPAVSGFEMMLRFIFPIYDVFHLYGRPTRLIPEKREVKSLMFAMPQDRRTGYLEIFDVVTLLNNPASQGWSEREWKKQMKQLTLQRLDRLQGQQSQRASRETSRHSHRNSLPSRGALRFADNNAMRSTPSLTRNPQSPPPPPPHAQAVAPGQGPYSDLPGAQHSHKRSVSDAAPTSVHTQHEGLAYQPMRGSNEQSRPRMALDDDEDDTPPLPPQHDVPLEPPRYPSNEHYDSEDSDRPYVDAYEHRHGGEHNFDSHRPFSPVVAPPKFSHEPGAVPATRPNAAPELRRANSRMSSATLSQLAQAGNFPAQHNEQVPPMPIRDGRVSEDEGSRGVNANDTRSNAMIADQGLSNQGLVQSGVAGPPRGTLEISHPSFHSTSPIPSPPRSPQRAPAPESSQQNLQAPPQYGLRSTSPLSQTTSASEARIDENQAERTGSLGTNASQSQLPIRPGDERPATSGSGTSDTRSSARPGLIQPKPLARKPVPSQSPVRAEFPPRVSSVYYSDAPPTQMEALPNPRRDSDHADVYSTDSQEYASSRGSADIAPPPQGSFDTTRPSPDRDRPRSGVLRTVGTLDPAQRDIVVGDARYQTKISSEPPRLSWGIDFGPTQLYDPTLPGRQGDENWAPTSNRNSYGHSRQASTSSPNVSLGPTPEKSQSRSASEDRDAGKRRSQAWQPGHALGSPSTDLTGLTPEQFVQQRAAAGRVPPFTQHRPQGTPLRADPTNASGNFATPAAPGLAVRNQQANMAVHQALASGRTSQQSYASSHRMTPPMQQVPGHFPATPQYYDGSWEEGYMQGASGVGWAPHAGPHAAPPQQPQDYRLLSTAYGAGAQTGHSHEEAPYRGSYRPGQNYRM